MTHAHTLTCRLCSGRNRVPVQRALKDLSKPTCGKCGGRLLRVAGEPLSDLHDDDLAHPWDRDTLAVLKALPKVDQLLSSVMARTVDKVARFRYLGGAIEVGSNQLPTLWRLHTQAADRLAMSPTPLYVVQSPVVNAWATGAGAPFIVVTTATLDLLDDTGVQAVLGHELTHVRLGHALYRTLARLLMAGGVGLVDRFFSIGSLLIKPVEVALLRWYQMSELSADRGGLLAIGDLDAHIRVEMALAGGSSRFMKELSPDAFLAQAERAEQMRDGDLLLRVTDMLDEGARSHPLPVWRAHHAAKWAESEAFFQILAGQPRPVLTDQSRS
ncbi:MAG: M48 family metalloprotease [Myxococcales bacterium]|nr:M48 family metalloprotease [Myxococcales bacterium]